ncbi:MAG: hypothetical protein HN348_23025 [Proteobacteria bacterium]|jgi:hypothetical protein|nr:hypothetical protein [Pseudomonadota bacterium]
MWWMLLATMAMAGKLQVDASTPVIVVIDGAPADYPEGRMSVTTGELRSGNHLIEVRNLLGKRITEMEVQVPFDQMVKVTYKGKLLSVTDSERLKDAPIIEEVVAPVESAITTIKLDIPDEDIEEAPTTVPVGSVEFVVPGSSEVTFADKTLKFSSNTESFVVTEKPAADYATTIIYDGETIFEGILTVQSRQNQRCVMNDQGLDCQYSEPQLGLPEVSFEMAGIDASTLANDETEEVPTGPVEVIFTIQDPMDLSTVFLDGAKVTQFRKGDVEHRIEIQPGVHVVEIRDFFSETWFKGKFTAESGTPIELTYGEDEGVEITSSNGDWEYL